MFNRTSTLALAGLLGGLVMTMPMHASGATPLNTNILSFSQPVALPGVTLTAGRYIFERAELNVPNVIVVRDVERTRVYFLGFTDRVDRPRDLPTDAAITLAEARPGTAAPITAWYPIGERRGHQFRYGNR